MAAPGHIVGRTFGHYRIIEQIGAGGMGMVYRARDERLERDVALKLLPPGTLADAPARKRFRQEALALSRLNHPNIATVHDFDTQDGADFLVTEFIPGVTLDEKLAEGALPERQVIDLASQLVDGLEAAHRAGVIHRDLKPGNLRLTPEGRLKILDFGLAMRMRAAEQPTVTGSDWRALGPVGTLAYMAPEQLTAGDVDERSDLWAVGVLLYELVTARRPFTGKTITALTDEILHAAPPEPQLVQPRLSSRLADLILKCLEKDAARRYQSAKELQVDLRRLQAPTSATPAVRKRTRQRHIRSLAVLPLANFSRDPEQEFFADGMTEALICELAKLQAVKVTSRTSVMRYKGAETPLPQIARELNVDAVLEGSFLRAGQRVRITAQLIHAASDTHLWAENYERDLQDVLLVQSEIARAIAREIRAAVTPEEAKRFGRARRVDPEAYEAYLKGHFHWYKHSREHLDKAMECFEFALQKDPHSALAYTGIAWVWFSRGDCGVVPPREVLPKARAAAMKAVELDDSLAEAHLSAGALRGMEWDWAAAEKEYRRAIELSPGSAEAHFLYADLLVSHGRPEEWKVQSARARELDPLNSLVQSYYGWHLLYLHRYDEAIAELRKTLRTDPDMPSVRLRLWGALFQIQKYEEALAEARTFFELVGGKDVARALQSGYSRRDYAGAMRCGAQVLEARSASSYVQPTQAARLYAHAGDKDQALRWLEKAYDEHLPALCHLAVDTDWEVLRGEPRFRHLLRRLNFEPSV